MSRGCSTCRARQGDDGRFHHRADCPEMFFKNADGTPDRTKPRGVVITGSVAPAPPFNPEKARIENPGGLSPVALEWMRIRAWLDDARARA